MKKLFMFLVFSTSLLVLGCSCSSTNNINSGYAAYWPEVRIEPLPILDLSLLENKTESEFTPTEKQCIDNMVLLAKVAEQKHRMLELLNLYGKTHNQALLEEMNKLGINQKWRSVNTYESKVRMLVDNKQFVPSPTQSRSVSYGSNSRSTTDPTLPRGYEYVHIN